MNDIAIHSFVSVVIRNLLSGRRPTTQSILPVASQSTICCRFSINDTFWSVRKSLTSLLPFMPKGTKRSPRRRLRIVRGKRIAALSRHIELLLWGIAIVVYHGFLTIEILNPRDDE